MCHVDSTAIATDDAMEPPLHGRDSRNFSLPKEAAMDCVLENAAAEVLETVMLAEAHPGREVSFRTFWWPW